MTLSARELSYIAKWLRKHPTDLQQGYFNFISGVVDDRQTISAGVWIASTDAAHVAAELIKQRETARENPYESAPTFEDCFRRIYANINRLERALKDR